MSTAPGQVTMQCKGYVGVGISPRGVACTPYDMIVVCEHRGPHVSVLHKRKLQTPSDTKAQDVACSDNTIFVSDKTTGSILTFNMNGDYLKAIDLCFDGFAGICVNNNKLYVASDTDDTVTVIDLSDKSYSTRRILVQKAGLQGPEFVAANDTSVAVTSFNDKTVHVFDHSGTKKFIYKMHPCQGSSELGLPHGLAFDAEGRLLISDYNNNCIHFVSKDGQFLGYGHVSESSPTGLAINSQGLVVVAGWSSKCVGMYRYTFG